ncbi:polyprenyl synthetase family protein [Neoehrlichia mikurensis]|uniref:Polyprenyl synthetase family protein n=1 Tax=Neoehrlichia mikurensis TaxID=89586 RepID=A0A9Q9F426_9RICK|nr:polyprenyl synthetase family protein [Neoehrlichia mikurensis]QXK92278.1 polyprenyl synthetase family protein [Neoehrlichia mikurensis]QXK92732.1 polyprenyl synthetase family protein [Neoehrlichia mikurensis]QXK93973.1 polyprenyl synthetase family protein [Neoehrlichia mikurensis]UTO55864.1 polyprenyl synthetase family protein [Neoehrlichia mikurensis]UTO56780.1 polyprenyl synthetase family protein [Neoehrlichia mikurensis]
MIHQFHNLLNDLKTQVIDDLNNMENLMTNQSHNKISLITDIMCHLIQSGGKRIRPIILFTICKMLNYHEQTKIYVAAAIEFIHNATLLHDDVIDSSELRRGVRTSNFIWGNKASILVGDFLLASAFQWITLCNSFPLLSILSQASNTIITGEIKQMFAQDNINITQEEYIEIISAKTASLFSATCESAALISNATIKEQNSLKDFGYNLGISFQIIDDILDYTAQNAKFGKSKGNDFYEGKVTLPIIIAYKNATKEEKEFWDQLINSKNKNFEQALAYIKAHNVIHQSIKFAQTYINKAKHNLETFSESKYKLQLYKLLDSIVHREF